MRYKTALCAKWRFGDFNIGQFEVLLQEIEA